MTNNRLAQLLAVLLPVGLLGGALISEHVFGLYPCEMCIWQRWPLYVAVAIAGGAVVLNSKVSRFLLVGAALAILISGLIGGFHAGVEYGWWEGITSCATPIDTSGDMLDSIMNAPLVRCDVAPWTLFGVSLAGFNFLISVGGSLFILWLMIRDRKERDNG